jgi:FixJ family two-component response regulator
MSGASIPQYVHRSIANNGYEFLSKPFTEKQLLDAVERSLRYSPESI